MAQSSTPSGRPVRGFFFVLQPNETGATGSHQAGEIHLRKTLLGDVFPPLAPEDQNVTVPIRVFNAQVGEWATCSYTHWGKRKRPEDRLRQFPKHWRAAWEHDDLVVLIPAGDGTFVLYHLKPTDPTPPGLEVAWEAAKHETHGRFGLRLAK